MIVVLLSMYAGLVTVAVLVVYVSQSGEDGVERELSRLATTSEAVKDRVEALKVLGELQRNKVRWFERAISSIGVFALITMTVGTAVQTIRSAVQEREAKEWEQRSTEAGRRVEQADNLIASIADTVLEKSSRVALLTQDEKAILQYRLERLYERPQLDQSEREEVVNASIALREFSRSVSLIARQPALFDTAAPADQVSLAEYYYLTGDKERGRMFADRASVHRFDLNRTTAMRLIVIRFLLGTTTHDGAVAEAAEALKTERGQAEIYLNGDTAAFNEGMQKLRATR